MTNENTLIAYTCCYTPLPVIDAAGFTPYRILPMGNTPDQAGRILHDNLCPHVKRILDRGLSGDLPALDGMVFMNSCDAMRRLSDAWKKIKPGNRYMLCDLPSSIDEESIDYFKNQLLRLKDILESWSGKAIPTEAIRVSIGRYNELSHLLHEASSMAAAGRIPEGGKGLQALYNKAMTEPLEDTIQYLKKILTKNENTVTDKIPVFLFGNVLPDPEVFDFVESCGARVISNDLCTGSRMFTEIQNPAGSDPVYNLAKGLLTNPPCSRTIDTKRVNWIGEHIIEKARESRARGIIGHTMKFCDPYILRLPMIREMSQKEGLPLLLLEGDCTMRSLGQQRTRIEAFIEMLR